jgi:hypothetical protein
MDPKPAGFATDRWTWRGGGRARRLYRDFVEEDYLPRLDARGLKAVLLGGDS